jgi:uncharacterized cupredoxin-like copper-binding protein
LRLSRPIVLAIVIVVVLVASAAYYASQVSSGNSSSAITIHITIVGTPAANTTDTYVPDHFTVHEGQQVTLVVQNTDDNTHGLVIDAFNVNTGVIQSGDTARVVFTPNQAGTFTYYEPPGYCGGGVGNVCNSIQNMTGTMTVLP